jgi:hypothetical protein
MVVWAHEIDIAQGFPYSLQELRQLDMAQLRFVARICPSWVRRELLSMKRDELINWILGDQPQAPLVPWEAPVRADTIPTFEEIRPPRQ